MLNSWPNSKRTDEPVYATLLRVEALFGKAVMARIVATTLLIALAGMTPAKAGPFGAWVAAIVAGDNTADGGAPTEVFDNARRDIARHLGNIGFDPANIRQFSVQPGRYVEQPLAADYDTLNNTVGSLTQRVRGGCFVYITSHGTPQGIVVNGGLFSPESFAGFLNANCGDAPSVIVLSACYSGVFIPFLASDNRMIFTAARPDRPSFGCGVDYMYTFFDQCFLESFPNAETFPELAVVVTECVAQREIDEGVEYPSEPQLYVGGRAASLLQFYTLDPG